MEIKGWRYYNHAAIPRTPPHKEPDMGPINNGSIWKLDGTPLLARWTTDFDCGYETNWWYLIKEAPFDIEKISAKNRKSIRQALKKCYVKKINPVEYEEDLYKCYLSAVSKYENADNVQKSNFFLQGLDESLEFWAGFEVETNKLIGWASVKVYDQYATIQSAKFDPEHSKSRVSDAIYFTVLDHYLNECGKPYVCSGERNINHKTRTQEYKIERFGYRKAYCHLHMAYNPKIKPFVKMLYPFRKLLTKIDKVTLVHQINAVLKMEELSREQR